MGNLHTWSIVSVIAFVTAALRFLPFAVFNDKRRVPRIIDKLGKLLPYSIMGMLVVYCLKGVHFIGLSGFLPEFISCIVVGVLYVWRRNTLLSIILGTVCYMVLVQAVF